MCFFDSSDRKSASPVVAATAGAAATLLGGLASSEALRSSHVMLEDVVPALAGVGANDGSSAAHTPRGLDTVLVIEVRQTHTHLSELSST